MDRSGSDFGAWLGSYGAGFKPALETARTDGFRLIEADATAGVLRPRELSQSARRHLARHLRDLGLGLHGLGAEFEGSGLSDPSHADARLAELRDVVALARELAAPVVQTRVCDPSKPLGGEILREIARLADGSGVRVVVHGPAGELAKEVRSLGVDRLAVGLDSAASPDAAADARACDGVIGGVFLRDVRRHERNVAQVPFGEGEADFPRLLAELARNGYVGPYTLRWDGPGGARVMRRGLEYFRMLGRGG